MTLPHMAVLPGLSPVAADGPQGINRQPGGMRAIRQDRAAGCGPADRLRTPAVDRLRFMAAVLRFRQAARVVGARKCALLQWQGATEDKGKYFDAASMLTMIDANGRGAARNFDLALKFACEVGGAPAENSGRVAHPERLKKQRWTGNDFRIRDDITSGAMMGICAAVRDEFDSVARQRRRDALMSAWRPAEQDAWRALRKAVEEFFAASASREADTSATGRGAFEVGARAARADRLLKAVAAFEHGALPQFAPDEFIPRAPSSTDGIRRSGRARFEYGTVNADGIRTAQRAWLRDRDAWVSSGKSNIRRPRPTAGGPGSRGADRHVEGPRPPMTSAGSPRTAVGYRCRCWRAGIGRSMRSQLAFEIAQLVGVPHDANRRDAVVFDRKGVDGIEPAGDAHQHCRLAVDVGDVQ
jgi:hypothetical protein